MPEPIKSIKLKLKHHHIKIAGKNSQSTCENLN